MSLYFREIHRSTLGWQTLNCLIGGFIILEVPKHETGLCSRGLELVRHGEAAREHKGFSLNYGHYDSSPEPDLLVPCCSRVVLCSFTSRSAQLGPPVVPVYHFFFWGGFLY